MFRPNAQASFKFFRNPLSSVLFVPAMRFEGFLIPKDIHSEVHRYLLRAYTSLPARDSISDPRFSSATTGRGQRVPSSRLHPGRL